ncbi:MAG: class I SAM-dependent methyltransferase [Lachnospiraceae bacterium]|nr:class I SAM-dependent methyltransferase [Lachnospiraceae bacterium]
MDIEKQFNLIAEEYDGNRRKFIPCFDDFYQNTTKFIVSNINEPKRIIDLGAGTGLLTYFWYQQCPNSEYVLVDIADEMLNVARKRFESIGNVSYQIENYIDKLPDVFFDTVISALSIHHLEDEDKSKLFTRIYNRLPSGGLFINYDQFCAGQEEINNWFNSYWENQLATSGLMDKDIQLWKERRKLDRECSVEQEVDMLKNAGFNIVKCVYSYQKFSVIVAIK